SGWILRGSIPALLLPVLPCGRIYRPVVCGRCSLEARQPPSESDGQQYEEAELDHFPDGARREQRRTVASDHVRCDQTVNHQGEEERQRWAGSANGMEHDERPQEQCAV